MTKTSMVDFQSTQIKRNGGRMSTTSQDVTFDLSLAGGPTLFVRSSFTSLLVYTIFSPLLICFSFVISNPANITDVFTTALRHIKHAGNVDYLTGYNNVYKN